MQDEQARPQEGAEGLLHREEKARDNRRAPRQVPHHSGQG